MSELCELFGKLSRRCVFLLSNRNSISVSRSRGNAGGGSRGGSGRLSGGLFEGDESDESDDTGVADPHENLRQKIKMVAGHSTAAPNRRDKKYINK